MKIIANYLPQYHIIPENSEWWGEGYTDWVAVKNAKALYEGHNQPRIPLDDNYYDLSEAENIRWQAKLAANYGIYGFGIYHYWFGEDRKLLERPAELIRDNEDIDIHYMFIWDNVSWARSWSNVRFSVSWTEEGQKTPEGRDNAILEELVYGGEPQWKKHFDYLMTFFKDERYIKIDNKPVFAVFNQNNKPEVLRRMVIYWDKLAREAGYNGICVIGKKNYRNINISDYQMNYEPAQSALQPDNIGLKILYKCRERIHKGRKPNYYDYTKVWKRILKRARKCKNENEYFSAFVDFDDSPRRGINARIFRGFTAEKFRKYLMELLVVSKKQNKEYVFITAWNEWGEGAYLEPDTENGYRCLEAVKECVEAAEAL